MKKKTKKRLYQTKLKLTDNSVLASVQNVREFKENEMIPVVSISPIKTSNFKNNKNKVPILQVGKTKGYTRNGKVQEFEIKSEDLKSAKEYNDELLKRNSKWHGFVDLEHEAVYNTNPDLQGKYKNFEIEKDEKGIETLYATMESWTPSGEKNIEKGIDGISAFFDFNWIDSETGKTIPLHIKNFTITKDPLFTRLAGVLASNPNLLLTTNLEDKPMNEIFEYLVQMLGLSKDSKPDTVLASLKNHFQMMSDKMKVMADGIMASNEKLKLLGVPENSTLEDVMKLKVKDTNPELTVLANNLKKLETEMTVKINEINDTVFEKEFNTVIASYSTSEKPKLSPAVRKNENVMSSYRDIAKKSGLNVLRDILEHLPNVIIASDTNNDFGIPKEMNEIVLSDVQKKVNAKFGLKDDDVIKTLQTK